MSFTAHILYRFFRPTTLPLHFLFLTPTPPLPLPSLPPRFVPAWQAARRLLDEGALGRLHYADVRVLMPSTKNTKTYTWWTQEDKGGGVLGAIGSHMIDSLRWLLRCEVSTAYSRRKRKRRKKKKSIIYITKERLLFFIWNHSTV